jgi:hypothetical protein
MPAWIQNLAAVSSQERVYVYAESCKAQIEHTRMLRLL